MSLASSRPGWTRWERTRAGLFVPARGGPSRGRGPRAGVGSQRSGIGTIITGGSSANVSGVVTDGVDPIPGGVVELALNGVLQDTVVPNGSGAYSFGLVPNGAYKRMYHAPPTHCCKVGETGSTSEAYADQPDLIVSGVTITNANFLAQAVVYVDTFSSYANIAAALSTTTGIFGSAKAIPSASQTGTAEMTLSNDGPSSEQVFNYHWDTGVDVECNLVGGNNGHSFVNGIWVQTYTKEGADAGGVFNPGSVEYKWCLTWLKRESSGSADNGFHIEIQPGGANVRFRSVMNSLSVTKQTSSGQSGCVFPGGNPCDYDTNAAAFFEQWHLTTVRGTGLGTASQNLSFYLDAVKKFALEGDMTNDVSTQVGLWQMGGANLNGTNPQNQYRRHRLWQVADARPGLRVAALIV